MNTSKAIEILSALAQGVDPFTGEVYPDESAYNNIETIRALFLAVEGLRRQPIAEKQEKKVAEIIELTDKQKELFDILKKWRWEQAKMEALEAYMVLSNDALSRVAQLMPLTVDELLKIKGFGEIKVQKYGTKITEIVQEFNAG